MGKPGSVDLFTDEYFDAVNEILKTATAEGAYCVGAVSALSWIEGKKPPVELMRSVSGCKSIKDGVEFYNFWNAEGRHA